MASNTLELTLISAKDVKDVNFFSKMEVYAVASIDGAHPQRTPADRNGGRSPAWNHVLRLPLPPGDPSRHTLHVLLRAERALGDRDVGEVQIPLKEILDGAAKGGPQFLSYQIRKPSSSKSKGVLNLSYKIADPAAAAAAYTPPASAYAPPSSKTDAPVTAYPPPPKASKANEPVTAYPAGPSYVQPGAAAPYAQPAGYPAYPPQYGYPGAPPVQAGYGYPPPPPQAGYGYGAPPPGYGYGAAQPVAPKRNNFGMGLGAGLLGGALGGMLIGDMVSDAGAYDAGYDAGFDDGGGFDF